MISAALDPVSIDPDIISEPPGVSEIESPLNSNSRLDESVHGKMTSFIVEKDSKFKFCSV